MCPNLKELIIDVGARGKKWDHPLWDLSWYQGRPHHSNVTDIGLRGLAERVRLASARSYIEDLVDMTRFPALEIVRDLGFRSARDGPVWGTVLDVCAARGVLFTDSAGNNRSGLPCNI